MENEINQTILQNVYLIRDKKITPMIDRTYFALAKEIINGTIRGFFLESHHLLESGARQEVINLNKLAMYNALYLKVNQQLRALLSVDNYETFKSHHGEIDQKAFEIKKNEFLDNITQQVIIAELFTLTIQNVPDRELNEKEKRVQGFVNQIFTHMDKRIFEIIYMQEEKYHMQWISTVSNVVAKYYYLSDIIEGMGIPLFEVIENAQKENEKIVLREMFPHIKEEEILGKLSDPGILRDIVQRLKQKNIFIRCGWFIEESKDDSGNSFMVVKIAVTNHGQLSEEAQRNIQDLTRLEVQDKSLSYFFNGYSERSLSAGIGLPMVNFLVEEFKQKGIEAKFSISNASQKDFVVAEMRFVI